MNSILVMAVALAWVLILAGIWLGWQLLRQNGRLLLRIESLEERLNEMEFAVAPPEGLPVGSPAPEFELPDLSGARHSLAQFRTQPLLLMFFNPDCGYCRELAAKLAALPHFGSPGSDRHPAPLVITTGDAEKNRQFFTEHHITHPVLLQNDGELANAYQAHGTPTGYLISIDGKIASELAVGAEALLKLAKKPGSSRREEAQTEESEVRNRKSEIDQSLVTSAATETDGDRSSRFSNRSLARSKIARNGLTAGTPAPSFRLPRLDGRGELALEDLRGHKVLLVFSDPHCGPCDALAPRLEQLHREHQEIRVVMISRGEPKENRAKVKQHQLTFPNVLQQQWEISRRYAMFATPIAYLIDEAGVITHNVAAGEAAILALLSETAGPSLFMPRPDGVSPDRLEVFP